MQSLLATLVLGVTLLNLHTGDDYRTLVMKDGASPYFVDDVLVYLGVESLKAQRILEIPE